MYLVWSKTPSVVGYSENQPHAYRIAILLNLQAFQKEIQMYFKDINLSEGSYDPSNDDWIEKLCECTEENRQILIRSCSLNPLFLFERIEYILSEVENYHHISLPIYQVERMTRL